jgi:hypothetical protein
VACGDRVEQKHVGLGERRECVVRHAAGARRRGRRRRRRRRRGCRCVQCTAARPRLWRTKQNNRRENTFSEVQDAVSAKRRKKREKHETTKQTLQCHHAPSARVRERRREMERERRREMERKEDPLSGFVRSAARVIGQETKKNWHRSMRLSDGVRECTARERKKQTKRKQSAFAQTHGSDGLTARAER